MFLATPFNRWWCKKQQNQTDICFLSHARGCEAKQMSIKRQRCRSSVVRPCREELNDLQKYVLKFFSLLLRTTWAAIVSNRKAVLSMFVGEWNVGKFLFMLCCENNQSNFSRAIVSLGDNFSRIDEFSGKINLALDDCRISISEVFSEPGRYFVKLACDGLLGPRECDGLASYLDIGNKQACNWSPFVRPWSKLDHLCSPFNLQLIRSTADLPRVFS